MSKLIDYGRYLEKRWRNGEYNYLKNTEAAVNMRKEEYLGFFKLDDFYKDIWGEEEALEIFTEVLCYFESTFINPVGRIGNRVPLQASSEWTVELILNEVIL